MTIFTLRQSSPSTTSAWMRWLPFWHLLFYLSLIVTTGIASSDYSSSVSYILQLLSFSIVLGLWYAIWVKVYPVYWQKHPVITMVYLAAGWAIWFRLTSFDPVYLFVLVGLYPQVFSFIPLFVKILGAFLLTLLAVLQQFLIIGGLSGNLFLTLGAAIAGVIIALFIHTIVDQSQNRQNLIEELHLIRNHIEQACRTARENLVETRRLLLDLQPVILDHVTLPEAIIQLTNRWSVETGINASASFTGVVYDLRPEIEVTLLRSAQEALANVRKHSKASKVTLTLSYMNESVALDIQDDGIGFDTGCLNFFSIEQTGRFGLKALNERVTLLGGMFSIESILAEGTTVAVALPAIQDQTQLSFVETHEVPS